MKRKPRIFNYMYSSLMISIMMAACAKVTFQDTSVPPAPPQGCIPNKDKGCDFDYEILVGGGMVDILFVDDNSGSMSFEQRKMGERFPFLLKYLDDRLLDYRIGITTTDLSGPDNPPRAINNNGALQDGKLISFANGMKYLEPNTPSKSKLFLDTIQRNESSVCDKFLQDTLTNNVDRKSDQFLSDYYNSCPSGDERGIGAPYLTINNNADGFIRTEAHLAVVIISDENNRSWGIDDGVSKYALAPADKPQNFIDMVKQKYGANKTLAVHSIVVPTGNKACLVEQNTQIGDFVNGAYGTSYEQLSDLTSGVKGSVCAKNKFDQHDYGEQMGRIGAAIVKQVETFDLHCANPINLQVTYNPASSGNTYTINGKSLHFANALAPSSRVHFKYGCP